MQRKESRQLKGTGVGAGGGTASPWLWDEAGLRREHALSLADGSWKAWKQLERM